MLSEHPGRNVKWGTGSRCRERHRAGGAFRGNTQNRIWTAHKGTFLLGSPPHSPSTASVVIAVKLGLSSCHAAGCDVEEQLMLICKRSPANSY